MSDYRKLILPVILMLGVATTTTATAQHYQPFGPLLGEEFDHDWKIFAPADVSSYGGGPDANYGLYATYDRLHFSSGRSNDAPSPFEGDWAYGNRMDFGYMTDDDHGWLLEVMKVSRFGNGLAANDAYTTQLTSGELMKTWRQKPLHHGSIVETFLGFRYTVLKHALANDLGVAAIENNIYGPQAGLRWSKQKGRWTVSSEGRYFLGYNEQHFGPTSTDAVGHKEENWVHAGDIRAEVTYDITKSFAFSVGWEFLYFGDGIARGDGPVSHDQNAYFTGATIGFKFNR